MNDESTASIVLRGDLSPAVAGAIRDYGRVAVDTETTGLSWQDDELSICQIFVPPVGAVIVQLDDGIPVELAGLLRDSSVEKVFHHAPFDLRFMMHAWRLESVSSIRCTKVASKLIDPNGPHGAHSLSSLVSEHLGVDLPKGDVRTSNWQDRNLTTEQIAYAANDVRYLLPLLDLQQSRLAGAGLQDIYDECCRFLPTRVRLELGEYPDVFSY